MKTAISLPDQLFRLGEEAAERLGVSRSQLYAIALADYLKREDKSWITKRLNEVYADGESDIDPVMQEMALETLKQEPW